MNSLHRVRCLKLLHLYIRRRGYAAARTKKPRTPKVKPVPAHDVPLTLGIGLSGTQVPLGPMVISVIVDTENFKAAQHEMFMQGFQSEEAEPDGSSDELPESGQDIYENGEEV